MAAQQVRPDSESNLLVASELDLTRSILVVRGRTIGLKYISPANALQRPVPTGCRSCFNVHWQ